MKVLNMSEKKFSELEHYELEDSIFNTEAKMLIYESKNKWLKKKYILKKLYNDSGTVFSNKLYTVNELSDNKDLINIDELILPERLVSIHGDIVGFLMPFIENINFKTVMDSNDFSIEQKIDFLKEIGEILEKMKKVRMYTRISDFYLNDIHENNFILNKETGKINVVDLDSCKINNNLVFASRYLSSFNCIDNVSKYRKIDDNISVGGMYYVDENTEYYCYIIMILNYLYGSKITELNIAEFYNYLSYLHDIGGSYELLDMFSYIYMEKDNINPYEYLDELKYIAGRSRHNVYKLRK